VTAPRFSVVIPTFQRRELVLASVRALARQRFEGPFEIVVTVDGSTDGSADALRALRLSTPLTVLEQANRGASAARNVGAQAARGEILLFLDDDMEADAELLAALEQSHRAGADVVFGHLPLHPGSPKNFLSDGIRQWTDRRLKRLTTPGERLTLHDLMTGQMSLARALFEHAGGFDTNFTHDGSFGGEDIDFGYRLMRDGYRLVFNPAAISYQNYVVQPRDFLHRNRQAAKADVAFARKHPEQASAIFALNGSGVRINRVLWRPLAAMSPLSAPLMSLLRLLALAGVRLQAPSDRSIRFFYQVWASTYWRGVREAGGMPRPRPLRVLAYHAIKDLAGAAIIEPYGVPPDLFRHQLNVLRRLRFHFISADEFLQFLRHGGGLPPRPVLLTFDDAYHDLLDVLPVLKQLGIPGVVFAVSGRLGASNTWDEAIGAPLLRTLDSEGLRMLADASVETGAHSQTHPVLTQLSDQELAREIAGSIADLEVTGRRPRMFAYPYGEYDQRVKNQARSAGIEAAFTVVGGLVRSGTDALEVPRIEITRGDRSWKFLWKVFGAGRWSLPKRRSYA
jgi:peptidoglycan/xylan/chitin deacetylase (PgdA/CDA1 family)/GT2 family glycosyltransferase